MRGVLFWSGGKDSFAAYVQAKELGHEIICLATMTGEEPFKCHDIKGMALQTRALKLPHIIRKIKEPYLEGYRMVLDELISTLDIECVITGDLEFPDVHHGNWMDEVCKEKGLKLLRPLFGINRKELLEYLPKHNASAMITCASKKWFGPEWIGRILDISCVEELLKMGEKSGFDPCGENGEYHTFVLDADEFTKKIVTTWSGIGEVNGLWYMKSKNFALVSKNQPHASKK